MSLELQISEYGRATQVVLDAVNGLSEAALDYTPEGEWSVRWIIHHLADAEGNAFVRLRRLLAEPAPTSLQVFDEVAWSRQLRYHRPVETSLQVFAALRNSNVEILATLAESDLNRVGNHELSGPYTLAQWLLKNTSHALDHAVQIKRTIEGTQH